MSVPPAMGLLIVVLCPRLAPMAHDARCSFRHLFLPASPGRSGDWSGTVTDLDEIRQLFPGVLFHTCVSEALQNGTQQDSAITPTPDCHPPPPPARPQFMPEHRPRGEHPYDRS